MTLESQSRIVCNWMAPEPDRDAQWLPPQLQAYDGAWWRFNVSLCEWGPRTLDLDALQLIERRILCEAHGLFSFDAPRVLLGRYVEALSEAVGNAHLWHATAEQKIAALASVLPGRAE